MINRLVTLFLALTLAAGIALPAHAQVPQAVTAAATSSAGAAAPVAAEGGKIVVTVGFYPINVYGIDPTNGTFTYDGYVWLRWRGDMDPTETLEFSNAVDKSSISKTNLYEEPQVMPDGSRYQIMRIESQFFKPFAMSNFPLDKHDLAITVEDSLHGADELVYKIDQADTKFSPMMEISGWKLTGWDSTHRDIDYQSNFGDIGSEAQASKFSQLSYNITIARPESYFIWKLLLPLFVVLCGAWVGLLLNPELTETRAALPASALLTTVFLQQSYSDALPETGGLVLLDKIYVIAYVLIVATLARVIVKSRGVETLDEAGIHAMRKRDGMALCIQAVIFIGGTLALVSQA